MDKLYYISQGLSAEDHIQNIKKVCEVGCKLIQLRMKGFSNEEVLDTALKVRRIASDYGALLIVNDFIDIAQKCQADGVHLGKLDKDPKEAKAVLGNNMLIGGTANTLADCIRLAECGVHYIGLGPYAYTSTKENLSDILGQSGYKNILQSFHIKGYNIPIYAIGGIKKEDIALLIDAGVYGIAASGLLTNSSMEENKILIKELRQLQTA